METMGSLSYGIPAPSPPLFPLLTLAPPPLPPSVPPRSLPRASLRCVPACQLGSRPGGWVGADLLAPGAGLTGRGAPQVPAVAGEGDNWRDPAAEADGRHVSRRQHLGVDAGDFRRDQASAQGGAVEALQDRGAGGDRGAARRGREHGRAMPLGPQLGRLRSRDLHQREPLLRRGRLRVLRPLRRPAASQHPPPLLQRTPVLLSYRIHGLPPPRGASPPSRYGLTPS